MQRRSNAVELSPRVASPSTHAWKLRGTILLIAGSLLAFGSVAPWAAMPLMGVSALYALFCGVRVAGSSATRPLDVTLLVLLAAIAVQTVPLPPAIIAWLSPNLPEFFGRATLIEPSHLPGRGAWHSLSLDAWSTVYGLGLTTTLFLVFWACRHVLDQGGTHRLVRSIATLGFFVAVGSVIFRAASPHLLYGFWPTADATAEPMGPFVNRNHFATWMIMALPLAASYLLMRIDARPAGARPRARTARIASALEARQLWLAGSALAMLVSILVSLSRSGIVSAAAGMLASVVAAHRLLRGASRAWLAGGALLVAVVVAAYADINAVLDRWEQTFSDQSSPGRLAIWGDTLRIVGDFGLTGTGAGTYRRAMLVYQVALRGVTYFNQAHSHYLQVMAEGGLLLSVPTAAALVRLVQLARRRLREDLSPTRWLRVGAATGLFSVALQSVWETGLRMPANALLCAVLCAVVVHETPARAAGGPPAK